MHFNCTKIKKQKKKPITEKKLIKKLKLDKNEKKKLPRTKLWNKKNFVWFN